MKNSKMKSITIYTKNNILPIYLCDFSKFNYKKIDKFTEKILKEYFNVKPKNNLKKNIYVKIETKNLDLFFTLDEYNELQEVFK